MWYCIFSCHHHNKQVEVARACGSHGLAWQDTACSSVFILIYGMRTRKRRGAPPLRWEKCVLNDLGMVGFPQEDWEAKYQLKCVWRKMFWEFSHPGQESRPLRASGRRGQQTAVQYVYAERYSLRPFPEPVSISCTSSRRGRPVLVVANSSSHQGFA